MTDLKRLNGGIELIKHIIKTGKQPNQPWSQEKQQRTLETKNKKQPKG